jgi:hypothetical protein
VDGQHQRIGELSGVGQGRSYTPTANGVAGGPRRARRPPGAEPGRRGGELAKPGAELFLIVEQDPYPCAPEVPLPIAVGTREHLAGCGLSGTRLPNLDE